MLGHPEILRFNPLALRYVREAAAIAAFRPHDSTKLLVCDDAGQFKGLTVNLQLYWVHVVHHFKNLDPLSPEFRHILDQFLDSLWTYYEKLNHYKQAPCRKDKLRLWREFDNVFKPETGYYALDRRIKKVMQQKTELLTVLSFPQTPLHNNPCELDVREKVVQRKIRNCHRSTAGAKPSDIFLGLMGTYLRAAQAGMPKKQDQLLGVSKRSSLSNAHHPRTSENNRVLSPSRFPFSHKLLSNYVNTT